MSTALYPAQAEYALSSCKIQLNIDNVYPRRGPASIYAEANTLPILGLSNCVEHLACSCRCYRIVNVYMIHAFCYLASIIQAKIKVSGKQAEPEKLNQLIFFSLCRKLLIAQAGAEYATAHQSKNDHRNSLSIRTCSELALYIYITWLTWTYQKLMLNKGSSGWRQPTKHGKQGVEQGVEHGVWLK